MSDLPPQDLPELLTSWLPQQRWFGSKGRPVRGISVAESTQLVDGDLACWHLLVDVDLGEVSETYQLLLGRTTEDLPERLAHAAIGTDAEGGQLFDAAHDNRLTNVLLQLVAGGDVETGIAFRHAPGASIDTDLTSIVMGAEQSNTSLVFGDRYIFKLFRKVAPGLNPDLEITRALADAGCTVIVPPLGWLERLEAGAEPTTLGMLQPFLKSATEGWASATTSVRDLYAEGDLHADEVGGDFAGESERLGAATAQVHLLLAEVLPSGPATAEDNVATARLMHDRLDRALEAVGELAPYADALRSSYDEVADLPAGVATQRIHGDLHLGQCLRTDTGWVLIDFEGEPARPLDERRALMSPLRDVAGMLRSFDYAARHLLAEQPPNPALDYRAAEWAERNRSAFCDGYAAAAGYDPREHTVLMRALELDKAIYEVVYEARNRPGWLRIPLDSVARLVGEH